jgi:hypothetical protein
MDWIEQCALALHGPLQDGFERIVGNELELRSAQLQALRPQRNLCHRLLAAGIQDRQLLREAAGYLQQQGRFANARLPAQQRYRPGHQAAAEYTIELGQAEGQPQG